MKIEKSKLPKGYSYPLKSSFLLKKLNESKIIIDTQLLYSPDHQFFEAYYWVPNYNCEYYRLYIRTGTVVSSSAKHAKIFMETEVIPEFILWLNELIFLPENSPKLNGEIRFLRSYVI